MRGTRSTACARQIATKVKLDLLRQLFTRQAPSENSGYVVTAEAEGPEETVCANQRGGYGVIITKPKRKAVPVFGKHPAFRGLTHVVETLTLVLRERAITVERVVFRIVSSIVVTHRDGAIVVDCH